MKSIFLRMFFVEKRIIMMQIRLAQCSSKTKANKNHTAKPPSIMRPIHKCTAFRIHSTVHTLPMYAVTTKIYTVWIFIDRRSKMS